MWRVWLLFLAIPLPHSLTTAAAAAAAAAGDQWRGWGTQESQQDRGHCWQSVWPQITLYQSLGIKLAAVFCVWGARENSQIQQNYGQKKGREGVGEGKSWPTAGLQPFPGQSWTAAPRQRQLPSGWVRSPGGFLEWRELGMGKEDLEKPRKVKLRVYPTLHTHTHTHTQNRTHNTHTYTLKTWHKM